MIEVYKQVKIADPLEKGTLPGPLHTPTSKENFVKGIQVIKAQVSWSPLSGDTFSSNCLSPAPLLEYLIVSLSVVVCEH